jgi:hypothetical protein
LFGGWLPCVVRKLDAPEARSALRELNLSVALDVLAAAPHIDHAAQDILRGLLIHDDHRFTRLDRRREPHDSALWEDDDRVRGLVKWWLQWLQRSGSLLSHQAHARSVNLHGDLNAGRVGVVRASLFPGGRERLRGRLVTSQAGKPDLFFG